MFSWRYRLRVWLVVGVIATAGLSLAGCHSGGGGFDWPPAEKTTAWIPYVDEIIIPDEIRALRPFEITVRYSTKAQPELLDDSQYHWLVDRDYANPDNNYAYSIGLVRYPGAAQERFDPSFELVAANEVKFTFQFSQTGPQTFRFLSMADPAVGGTLAGIMHGHSDCGEYWYLRGSGPSGTTYRQASIDVLPSKFEDLYSYGYLPYVEELTAPRQLYADETVNVLVRLSTAGDGSGDGSLASLRDSTRQLRMLCFPVEPPAGEYRSVLQYDGIAYGTQYLQLYTAVAREDGGLELVFNKYPATDGDWLKSGQTGYDLRVHEFQAIQRPLHMYGDIYEVRVPYVEEVVFPATMVAGRPGVIRVKLTAGLPDTSGGLGYYLQQEWHGADDLNAIAVYEPHAQGLVTDEMLIIYKYILPGEHTLSLVSAPSPDDGGMPSEVMFGEPLLGQLPTGAIKREFAFTVVDM